jgi:UDP-glucose 4-epimerase
MFNGYVAVTGNAGYIGSVLCKLLLENNYYVMGFDRSIHRNDGVFSADNDIDNLIDKIVYGKIERIYHLAAKSVPISESVTNPLRYYDNNVGLTARFFNSLIDAGWKGHVVFASSAAVYPIVDEPVSEETGLRPTTHYGKSKLMCEQILESAMANGIRTRAFRFFNVAGAYNDFTNRVTLGDRNGHVLTKLCEAARSGTPFKINGGDYPTRDGTCIRDYVHVVDVCRAMMAGMSDMEVAEEMRYSHPSSYFKAHNLGTGVGISLLELVKEFTEETDVEVSYEIGPRRAGDVPYLVANGEQFIREYDFTYKYAISDMISSAWNNYAL